MKNIIFLISFLFLAPTLKSQTEDENFNQNQKLLIPVFPFAESTFQIGWEFPLSTVRDNSLLVLPGITLKQDSEDTIKGVRFDVFYKFYAIRDTKSSKHENIYLAPFFQYKHLQIAGLKHFAATSYYKETISSSALGLVLGINIVSENKFTFDIYFGGGIKYSKTTGVNINNYDSFLDIGYTGVFPKGGVQIGMAF